MAVATVFILINDIFRHTAPEQSSPQKEKNDQSALKVSRASGQHLFIASNHALAAFPALALAF